MDVEKISTVTSITAKTLQGQTTLVSQQGEELEKLVATFIDDFGVRNVSDSERKALRADKKSIVSDNSRF